LSESSNFSFPRAEHLKSKKLIEQLFEGGSKFKARPLVVRYLEVALPEAVPCQAMVSVSKRSFKRAVDRNRIKRLMRESWRLQKQPVLHALEAQQKQAAVVFIFVGKEMPTFEEMQKSMVTVVEQLTNAPL
jgi:ribonuclease P protein component